MAHSHERSDRRLGPMLIASIAINVVILVAQIIGGMMAGSIALIADALHNLTDVASLGLSYGAFRLAKRPANSRYTFAFQRAEVLAAVLNSATLIIVSVFVAFEAVQRLAHPQPVSGALVMAFAAFGMVANGLAAWLLRGHGSNLNVRSAVLHLVSDSVASLGVLVAGALIALFGWYVVDPIVSLALAAWMIKESIGLLGTAANILMQGVPESVELGLVKAAMAEMPGIESVHDLHVWALAPDNIVLSAHAVVPHDMPRDEATALLRAMKRMLHDRFRVEHATIEVEDADACAGGGCEGESP